MTAQQELDSIKSEYFALRTAMKENPTNAIRHEFIVMRNKVVALRSKIKKGE